MGISDNEAMNFAAVKHRFKPLSEAEIQALVREHGGLGGEQAVLEDVGLDQVAREAREGAVREPATKAPGQD